MNSSLAYDINDQIRILVVDDDPDFQLILEDLLIETALNHHVIFARSVPDAMAVIDKQDIDVVLLDYLIRPYTGFDLFTYIKKLNKQIPCIVLTNHDSPNLDEQSVDTGVSDLIAKRDLNAGVLKRSILYSVRDAQQKRRLEYLAHYDVLTGLLTRRLFYDHIEHDCEVAKRNPSYRFAVMFIDLDHFKAINDTHGHDAGDEVLKQFAARLKRSIRHVDLAARLGGDEFMVLLHDATPPVAHMIALKILRAMEEPIQIGSASIKVSPSIGIATNANSHIDVKSLISDADYALYCAKSSGRGTYCHFNAQQSNNLQQNYQLEKALKEAIQHRQFELQYLPRFNVETASLTGFEIRERWNHPKRGPLPFDEYAKEIKRLELESQYTKLIIDLFFFNISQLNDTLKKLKFAVNINPYHCLNVDFVESIIAQTVALKINPANIALEFDEAYLVKNVEQFFEPIRRLRRAGLNIVINRFGRLYSSLNVLALLPVNYIKIDQRLLNLASDGGKKASILKAVASVAETFDISTIIDGVESDQQFCLARETGCNEMQGLYFGEPVTLADLFQYRGLADAALTYAAAAGNSPTFAENGCTSHANEPSQN